MTTPALERLLGIITRLRDPARGCPWDREQTFATIAPYTIEEAYEVADAIERQDMDALRDELGDLLFQVVFHSELAAEQHAFRFEDVATAISDKMERRHPHVFAGAEVADAQAQSKAWEDQKKEERSAGRGGARILDDVPVTLPAMTRAMKLGKRASQVGFDWPDVAGVMTKIDEELAEVRAEIGGPPGRPELAEEVGDLLFAIANLCRHTQIDPEAALRRTNAKFERRFRHVEDRLVEQGKTWEQTSLAEMDALWNDAKRKERDAP